MPGLVLSALFKFTFIHHHQLLLLEYLIKSSKQPEKETPSLPIHIWH